LAFSFTSYDYNKLHSVANQRANISPAELVYYE